MVINISWIILTKIIVCQIKFCEFSRKLIVEFIGYVLKNQLN